MKRSQAGTLLIMSVISLGACAPVDQYRSRLLVPESSPRSGVSITWLGTAGVLVSDGRTGILIDPYVSRFGLFTIGFGLPLAPEKHLIRRWVERMGTERIQAVAVSHSHFDHAVDAPFFARAAGAAFFGSESTLQIGRGAGLAEKSLKLVQPGRSISLGDFSLTFIESRHGPALFGRIPYPGSIEQPLIPPRPARDYKLGATYAILIQHPCGAILHHGSAGYRPGMYDGIKADVILLGIAGRGDTETYLDQVPRKVKASMVIPIHFDDFFKPLDKGITFLYSAHFTEFCQAAEKSSLTLKTVPLGDPVRILPLN